MQFFCFMHLQSKSPCKKVRTSRAWHKSVKIATDGLETKSVDFRFVGQYEAEGHTLNSRLKRQGKGS